MGCGCGGKKTVVSPPSNRSSVSQPSQPRVYDVFDGEGALVASATNPVLARVEARRVGGTVVQREPASASQA